MWTQIFADIQTLISINKKVKSTRVEISADVKALISINANYLFLRLLNNHSLYVVS